MLSVTEAARAHLAGMLETANPSSPDSVVRIVSDKSGLSFMVDDLRDGDSIFDHEGANVLAIDAHVREELGDRTLDVEESDDGQSLMLR